MLVFPVPDSGAGCQGESAGWYPASDVVRMRASRDLSCPVADVRVERADDSVYRAVGCGLYEQYTCESDAVPGCNLENAAERESCEPAQD